MIARILNSRIDVYLRPHSIIIIQISNNLHVANMVMIMKQKLPVNMMEDKKKIIFKMKDIVSKHHRYYYYV
jgi:hypothetical protein